MKPKFRILFKGTFYFILFNLVVACVNNEIEYYESGKVRLTYRIENGERNGQAIEYYENGIIKTKTTFVNGIQNGKTYHFDLNGNLFKELYLKDGIPQDSVIFYYPNGIVREISILKDDKRNGASKTFYENGQLEMEGIFENGFMEGDFIFFNMNGRLDSVGNYSDGKLKSMTNFLTQSMIYKNIKGQFSIELVGVWKKLNEISNSCVFRNTDSTNFSIVYSPISLTNYVTLKDFVDGDLLNSKGNLKDFKLLCLRKEMTGIYEKYFLKCSASYNDVSYTLLVGYFKLNNFFVIYTLSASSLSNLNEYNQNLPIIQSIISRSLIDSCTVNNSEALMTFIPESDELL